MRTAYREHLDNFSHDLIVMGETVKKIMSNASDALINRSLEPAEEAISLNEELDEVRSRCEERAVLLLALENPMAKDLRQVVSSIYIVEDFYRMGQLSRHIAKAARRRHPDPVIPKEYTGIFEEMVRLVLEMSDTIQEILINPDPDLALALSTDDDAVDDLNAHVLNTLTQREWKGTVREAVETAQITRYYERYADHCVQVAGRMIYLVTGLVPDKYQEKLKQEARDAEFDQRMADLEKQFRA
ncbi:phosphate signaling complex protein PhoU [Corynebacterium flavescens]